MPMRTAPGGIRVPDLHQIAEEAWAEVLQPLPEAHRSKAACNPNLRERSLHALELLSSMPPSVTDHARASLERPSTVPVPAVEYRRAPRQVSFRITDAEHEDLLVAARLLGARPAQLARMFVLSGTRRALADQDGGG